MMKLSTLDFIRLLPRFMQEDAAVQGLAAGLNEIIPQFSASAGKLTTWDRIDDLSESELDALAWELNILWYETGANIETKRDLIKNSDKVYKHLGTKWAVENVISTYFGNGHIREWFEYDGEPGRFRVYSSNPSMNDVRMIEFLNILAKVKRASAKLDGIYIQLEGQMNLYAGAGYHETSLETYSIGATL